MPRRDTLLASLVGLALPLTARADAVGPPDPSVTCPRGAHVEANHCGTVCVARRCETDADCFGGLSCETVSVCAVDEPYCGGWTMEDYERITGACTGGCGEGECRTFRACATPGGADAGPLGADAGGTRTVTYGCGCRAVHPPGPPLGAALALVATLVWTRRRPRSP